MIGNDEGIKISWKLVKMKEWGERKKFTSTKPSWLLMSSCLKPVELDILGEN